MVAPLDQQDAQLQLQESNRGYVEGDGVDTIRPLRHARIRLAGAHLAQFGHDVRIEG
ncbi:MAG TPA: hypothetical protein VGF97_15070 [Rhizomicrobium sp.]